jgi:hypothetical protein
MGVTAMRAFLGLLLAASLALPAHAQTGMEWGGPNNQSSLALIAPTPATLANNNQIATTAWVNNVVNAGLPLASGKIWIGSVGNIATAQTPSGDLTVSNGGVFTFGTVNANVGTFGSATLCSVFTVNAKGLITAASQPACTPAIASITGLGTGVGAALAINVGSAGAPVLFNGAGGTPTSLVLTNATGLPVGSITGLGAGCATWLGTPSSANLRGCLTDESGTGVAYFQGGDIGTPSAGVGTNLTALNASNLGSGTVPAARGGAGTINGCLTANGSGVVTQCAMANISDYAQGTWTPTLVGSTSGSWVLATAVGSYEKIGRQITVRFTIQTSSASAPVGTVNIGGLPFTSANTANDNGLCFVGIIGGWTSAGGYTLPSAVVVPNSAVANMAEAGSALAQRFMPVGSLAASTLIEGMCNYHI